MSKASWIPAFALFTACASAPAPKPPAGLLALSKELRAVRRLTPRDGGDQAQHVKAAGEALAVVLDELVPLPEWTRQRLGRCPDAEEFQLSPSLVCAVGSTDDVVNTGLAFQAAAVNARAALVELVGTQTRTVTAAGDSTVTATTTEVELLGSRVALKYREEYRDRHFALVAISFDDLVRSALATKAAPAPEAAALKAALERQVPAKP